MNHPSGGALSTELEFYERNKERFLHEHTNRHLLIKGSELIGSFKERGHAVGEGVRRFGAEPFLARLSGEDGPHVTIPVLTPGVPCQS